MLCAKFGWIWSTCSGEEDFKTSSMYFRYFEIISPWKIIWTNLKDFKISSMYFRYFVIIKPWKGWGPSFEQTWIPIWLKFPQWFCRRRFLNSVNVFSLFRNYLPFGKGVAIYLNKLESPSRKGALCQIWLKLAVSFLRWRWKCEKFTTTSTTTTTDNGQILIRKAYLSLRLRWPKN